MNTKSLGNHSKRVSLRSLGKIFFLFGFCLFIAAGAFAQTTPPPENDDPDTPVPFDGGITLLAAAGVAYGIRQWKQERKENKGSEIAE